MATYIGHVITAEEAVSRIANIEVPGPNVVSVVFKEHEGSFLAGALAAQVVNDTSIPGIHGGKTISVIGGTESLGVDKFLIGVDFEFRERQ